MMGEMARRGGKRGRDKAERARGEVESGFPAPDL